MFSSITPALHSGGDVLVVEDDADIRDVIIYNLEKDGFSTRAAVNGQQAVAMALEKTPALILLDIMMPVCDGLTALKSIRQMNSPLYSVPVILLTARGEESDIVVGLELGADDYVTKPFSPKELSARIRANCRRHSLQIEGGVADPVINSEVDACINVGPIAMNLEKHEASVDGKPLQLTLAEFNLLQTLLSKPGKVFTRDQILEKIAGTGTYVIDRNVDVHVRSVRKKLEGASDLIQTVRGVGYKCKDGQSKN